MANITIGIPDDIIQEAYEKYQERESFRGIMDVITQYGYDEYTALSSIAEGIDEYIKENYIQNKKEIESMKNNEKEIKAEENGNEKYSKGLDALKYEVYTIDTGVTTAAFENPSDAERFVKYLNDNVTPSAIRPIVKANIIKADEGYQGWANHATWVINLHLDNEQNTQEMKREIILETRDEDKEKWIYEAAETLKSWVEDTMPELPPMWADMLNGYFEEVDFREIAEHEINEIGYNEENEKNKGKDLKKEFE